MAPRKPAVPRRSEPEAQPLKRLYLKPEDVTLELLEEALLIMADLVDEYGACCVPVFERIEREYVEMERRESVIERARAMVRNGSPRSANWAEPEWGGAGLAGSGVRTNREASWRLAEIFGLGALMFEHFPKSEFRVVAPDGLIRGAVQGIFDADLVTIPGSGAVILAGDELRRSIPNGTEEVFEVIDPVYHERFHSIPEHFQVKIKRKGSFPKGQGGNYNITISGNNSRLNLHSFDNSTNIVAEGSVFGDIRSVIEKSAIQDNQRRELLSAVDEMEAAGSDQLSFGKAYQRFIAAAAEHITVIAPFLPALGQMFA